MEAKEPTVLVPDPKAKAGERRGPKVKVTVEMFLKFRKTHPDWDKWSSRRLGKLWGVSHSAVLQHKGWKAMRKFSKAERPTDTVDDEIDDE